MIPSEWRPGLIRGYRLRFNLSAGKAAYANGCSDLGAEVWAFFIRLRAETSFVWRPRKAFRGEDIGRIGKPAMLRTRPLPRFQRECSIDEMNISRSREPSASESDYSLRKSHAAKLS